MPLPLLAANTSSPAKPSPEMSFHSRISRCVFSCATTSTVAGNSTLPLTWSKCVCVLMIVVTGLGVSSRILSISGCPQPGTLVSTSTTPSPVTNAAELPPPPRST